jgi:dihydrofolate reductase
MAERDTQVDGTTMPELLVDFITSLDGYGAAEGWPGWWGLQGPEYMAWLGERPEADYTVLMGANTYRLMSGLAAEGEPGRMRSLACRRSSSRPP